MLCLPESCCCCLESQKSWQIADKNGFLLKQAKMFDKTSAKALHVFFLTTISLLLVKTDSYTFAKAVHCYSLSFIAAASSFCNLRKKLEKQPLDAGNQNNLQKWWIVVNKKIQVQNRILACLLWEWKMNIQKMEWRLSWEEMFTLFQTSKK